MKIAWNCPNNFEEEKKKNQWGKKNLQQIAVEHLNKKMKKKKNLVPTSQHTPKLI